MQIWFVLVARVRYINWMGVSSWHQIWGDLPSQIEIKLYTNKSLTLFATKAVFIFLDSRQM